MPRNSSGVSCCQSCHDTIRTDTSMYDIEYAGMRLRVCCAMERAVTGITFDQQLDRMKMG
jgi:hypothetical protein